MRIAALVLAGATALSVAACGHNSTGPTTGTYARVEGLVVKAPAVTASPDAFLMGLPSTQELADGQRVKLQVGGPSLANAIAGQAVQFAPNLTLTFTMTASLLSGPPVTLAPADFAVHRAKELDSPVAGPAESLTTDKPVTWKLTSNQTPGQGYLVWRQGTKLLGMWSYVAEND